jgi:Domain of unknown function (DUF5666)
MTNKQGRYGWKQYLYCMPLIFCVVCCGGGGDNGNSSSSHGGGQSVAPGAISSNGVSVGGTVISVGSNNGVGENGTGVSAAAAIRPVVGMLSEIAPDWIVVDGVKLSTSGSQFDNGLGGNAIRSDLHVGMQLQVISSSSNSQIIPNADLVQISPSIRGLVTSNVDSTISLDIGNRIIKTSAATRKQGLTDISAVKNGDYIEVHGDAASSPSSLIATLIKKIDNSRSPDYTYEIRGQLTDLNPIARTGKVEGISFSYANSTSILTKPLTNGMWIRLGSNSAPISSTEWVAEIVTSDLVFPNWVPSVYIEGMVKNYQTGGLFSIDGISVDASTATGNNLVTSNDQYVALVGWMLKNNLKVRAVTPIISGSPVIFHVDGLISNYISQSDFIVRALNIDATNAIFSRLPSYSGPYGPNFLANGSRVRMNCTYDGTKMNADNVIFVP